MEKHFPHLIHYVVGEIDKEVLPANFIECPLVLVAQDEMTSQAHDTVAKSWVFENQHALRKKGAGHGLHQSDVICSIVGWLRDATQTLEYGKNYNGYWTGELFVKQVILISVVFYDGLTAFQLKEKIIPVFEAVHGPGYRALIMVDNSKGHSAYVEDALVANCMNVNPAGTQAHF
jgi:hypothetical protein